MGYEALVQKNPLRLLKLGTPKSGRMNLILARAGLGKTALLVQIALEAILRGQRVIHVSIGEGIDKTKVWYDDVLQHILQDHPVERPHELIDMVGRHRMIMTFKESSFSRPKLEERLNDLILQDIFRPNCLVVDGYDFWSASHAELADLRELMEILDVQAWFSAVRHREDERRSPAGVPAPCHEVDDLFDTVIVLEPQKDDGIRLDLVKKAEAVEAAAGDITLDPTTMMVQLRP